MVGKFQRKSIEGIERLGLEDAIGEKKQKRIWVKVKRLEAKD